MYDLPKNDNNNVTNNIFNLSKEIYNLENKNSFNPFITNGCFYYNPINFKNLFALKHPLFSEGQQDSMEFIRILLEDLSTENNNNKNLPSHMIINNEYKGKVKVFKEFLKNFKSREDSFINNIFYLQLINKFICSWGYESYTVDNLIDIPLLLPNEGIEVDINPLLI